ncbi:MAG: TatD family hydrolase [Candidatus Methylacidiphilales bacterium]
MQAEQLTDTHCHLDFPDFEADREAVIRRAEEAGVRRMITIGTNLITSRAAVALAESYPNVVATVGVHPNEVGEAPDDAYGELKRLVAHPRVVAVGECGLDYHYLPSRAAKRNFVAVEAATLAQTGEGLALGLEDGAVKARQEAFFRMQLDLAVELGLNVVVHQRDAWEDCLRIVGDYRGKLRAVFHCFGGSLEEAEELFQHGHLISVTGLVTFKNAPVIQDTVARVPTGAFMVETDCPYLAPVPYRGQRCEPWHTRLVAEKVAALRGSDLRTVAEETEKTAEAFFRFPSPSSDRAGS